MLLPILLILIVFAVLYGIIAMLVWTCGEYDRRHPIIDFKSFKKFYTLNPLRWHCHDSCVTCCNTHDFYNDSFSFGLLDFYKYRLWRRAQKKNQYKEKCNEAKKRMMDAVKQDIANSEAEAKRLQDEVLAELRQKYAIIPDDNLMELLKEYKKLYGKS